LIQFKLKELLDKRNMTMSELSKRSGISRATLSTLASGKTQGIQFSTLEKIAGALNITSFQGINGIFSIKPEYSKPRIIAFTLYHETSVTKEYLVLVEENLFGQKVHDTCIVQIDVIPSSLDDIAASTPCSWHLDVSFHYTYSGNDGTFTKETNPFPPFKVNTTPIGLETYRSGLLGTQVSIFELSNEIIRTVISKISLPKAIINSITDIKFNSTQLLFSLDETTFNKITGENIEDYEGTLERRKLTQQLDSSYVKLVYLSELTSSHGTLEKSTDLKLIKSETYHDLAATQISRIDSDNIYYVYTS